MAENQQEWIVINTDGSMNVRGRGLRAANDLYHFLLSISWPRFVALFSAAFTFVNVIFGAAYASLPAAEMRGLDGLVGHDRFLHCFFFSVQTFATIGYGGMSPAGIAANLVMTVEAFLGLSSTALATGLVFSRFARPRARVLFSRNMVVTTLDGTPSLVFRVANERFNQIVDAQVSVVLARNEQTAEGEAFRKLYDLRLRRARSPLFALTWTIIHPIDESSPLHGKSGDTLAATLPQLIVTLSGIDETVSQTIHARHSYLASDIVWNRRFADVIRRGDDGRMYVELARFHELTPTTTRA